MNLKYLSIFLDIGQLVALLSIIIDGTIIPNNLISLILLFVAVILIVLSVWEMRINRFYQVPDVKKQNKLITTGVYAYIRNPMYLSQILLATSIIINNFTTYSLIILSFLCWIFIQKINYEEKLLQTHFGLDFKKYVTNTKKLIPYIY